MSLGPSRNKSLVEALHSSIMLGEPCTPATQTQYHEGGTLLGSGWCRLQSALKKPLELQASPWACRKRKQEFAYLQQWKDGNFLRIFFPLSLMGKCTLLDPNLCYTSLWRSMHVMLVLLPFDERCYLVGKDCRDANSMEKLQIQADILCMTCWRSHWLL